MANKSHLEIIRQGVQLWNNWRAKSASVTPDLSEAELRAENLSEVNLAGVNLSASNLRGVDLSKADLTGADLSHAELSKANLTDANLSWTNLHLANLRMANFSRALLYHTNLREANLRHSNFNDSILIAVLFADTNLAGADFKNCSLGWSTFANIDLREVKHLQTVNHGGPLSIGIDTIYLSHGRIREVFLRGAGVPERFIDLTREITGEAYDFYSCFISYSSEDDDFVEKLYSDLRNKGVRCWFAPEDMKIGDRIRHAIDKSIRIHDKLLLILSKNSISSFWVEKEVETAFEEERERKKTILFPIRLDSAVMDSDTAWAADIRRTRHIGDFTKWKEKDAYHKAFGRLLRDLKEESNSFRTT